jgi:N-acetylmuramoyl-L-alanine amidase
MNLLSAIRCTVSYGALFGAGFCLWQAQAFWDQQSLSFRSGPNAWMDILRQHLVVVDAGHGGTDGGTQGYGVLEKRCSLAIAQRVDQQLRALGIRTLMTRRDDTFVELGERSAVANRNGASVFVSIHLNADATSNETSGVETYFCSRKRLGDLVKLRHRFDIAPGVGFKDKRSEWLARTIQESVCGSTGSPDRRARDSNYLVVMHSECPAILLECGYLTNEAESKRLQMESYQDKIATAVAQSVKKFLLATHLHPRRGIVFDPLTDAVATGGTSTGSP